MINKKEIKKYKRIPNKTNIYNNKYDINKYYTMNNSNIIRNNNNFNFQDNFKKNKKINVLNVRQKTESLNYPNQNKKANNIYGENFDEKKYKREYINVEDVGDGRIENRIETGISNDGQYLISVSSARKINHSNKNDNYEGKEENQEYEEEIDDNYIYEVPEKKVEEIIDTVTTKIKNLGDNYKFYESKHLNKPNISSFTKHRRRTKRTIYGNEEHEKRKVKSYNIRENYNENEDQNQNVIKRYEKEGKYIVEDENIAHAQANYSDEQQRHYENEEEK